MKTGKPTPIEVTTNLSLNYLYQYQIIFSRATILASILCHKYSECTDAFKQ